MVFPTDTDAAGIMNFVSHTIYNSAAIRRALDHCWIIVLLLLIAVQPANAQQTEPLDLPTYTALVREVATAARRNDRLGLEDAGARLAAVREVRVGDNLLPVDNRWLADELARPAPRTTLIATRLAALADALSLPASAAPADALERLRAILNRPPFGEREAQTPQWWTDFWNWVGRQLEALLRPLMDTPPAASNTAAWVVAALGALLLGGIVLYLVLGLRRSIVRGAQARALDAESGLTARQAHEQAGELARAGDTRTAVRFLYLAALLRLDERGLLRYDRSLTNREYLDRLRENPELRATLAPIVATFDQVWYGHAALTPDEFQQYTRRVEQLRGEP